METIKIHAKDKDQSQAVKAVLKVLKIPFESVEQNAYNPEFVVKIKESEKQASEGKKTRIEGTEELKKFLRIDDL